MHSPQWASSINSSLSKERHTWKNETNETRQRSVHVPLSIGRPWAGNPPPRNRPHASNSPCQPFSYSASTTHQPCWRSSGRIGPTSELWPLMWLAGMLLLAFERENRAYFAASVPDRGDEFFAEFDTRYAQLLAGQAAGTDYLHLLVAEGSEVVGRVNLTEVADGTAELGYRIAQKAAGQGLATAAVRKVRELAATEYGLTRLRARVTLNNPASRKVLEHNGFVAGGSLTLNGKPAMSYICELR